MGASGRVDSVFRAEGGGGPESLAVLGYSRDRKGVRAVSDITILIDDDPLVRMTWKTAAKRAGRGLRVFEGESAFFQDDSVPKDAEICVDWQLSEGETAELFLTKLREDGYENIRIATGRLPDELPRLDFVRGVVGKAPPW